MVLSGLERISQVLGGFYEDLMVWEASGRAPGGSPGTFSERFDSFEVVLGGGFGMVLGGFQKDLKVFGGFQEGLVGGSTVAGGGFQAP